MEEIQAKLAALNTRINEEKGTLSAIQARLEQSSREKLALEAQILEIKSKATELKKETKAVQEEESYGCGSGLCGIPFSEPECDDKYNHCLCKTCKCVFCPKLCGEQFYDARRGTYRHIGRCCVCMSR